MPRQDQTGPAGAGPMTGRRLGTCTGQEAPASAGLGPGRGRRRGRGQGCGRGRGPQR